MCVCLYVCLSVCLPRLPVEERRASTCAGRTSRKAGEGSGPRRRGCRRPVRPGKGLLEPGGAPPLGFGQTKNCESVGVWWSDVAGRSTKQAAELCLARIKIFRASRGWEDYQSFRHFIIAQGKEEESPLAERTLHGFPFGEIHCIACVSRSCGTQLTRHPEAFRAQRAGLQAELRALGPGPDADVQKVHEVLGLCEQVWIDRVVVEALGSRARENHD